MKITVAFDIEFDEAFTDKILSRDHGTFDGYSNLETTFKAAHGNLAELVGTEITISKSRANFKGEKSWQ